MIEEWFILLLLYCFPLLFKVWQKSGSCFCCYIVYRYCFRFDRGVLHVIFVILSTITVLGLIEEWFMLLLLYCIPLLFKVDKGVVDVVVVILSKISVLGLTEEWFMLLWLLYCLLLLFKVWQRSGTCCFGWL